MKVWYKYRQLWAWGKDSWTHIWIDLKEMGYNGKEALGSYLDDRGALSNWSDKWRSVEWHRLSKPTKKELLNRISSTKSSIRHDQEDLKALEAQALNYYKVKPTSIVEMPEFSDGATDREKVDILNEFRENLYIQPDVQEVGSKAEELERFLRRKIVIDEKLLNKHTWTFRASNEPDSPGFYLDGVRIYRDNWKELLDAIKDGDYHFSFHMDDNMNVDIRFDDGDICLVFSSDKVGWEFIKANGLTIELGNVEDRVKFLESELDNVRLIEKHLKENLSSTPDS